MSRFLTVFLLGAAAASAQSIPVPSEYQDLYSTLATQISGFDTTVKAGWNGSHYPVLYGPQLQSASSDQYTDLLASYYYSNSVTPELDEEQALGAKAVTVHICFPILYQPFYTANPSQYQQFVNFYQQLATDIHARGMKMIVENVTMSSFPGNMASSFTSYYESLTWTQYMAGRAANVLSVAQLISPDYMTVITEPDTEAENTGQANAGTTSGSLQLLQTILSTLQTAGEKQVPIGAGAGTWINSFTQYIQNFASTSVQFVDMHIYPVNNNDFLNALTAVPIIKAAGKEISISEAWDYKVRNNELGRLSYTTLYARDPFSFWEPIDIAFLQALMDFGNSQKVTFIAPFWSHYFFGYLDFNTYGSYSNTQIILDSDLAEENAIAVGSFTPTGIAWLNGTIAAPDTTKPATPAAPIATAVLASTLQIAWTATTDNIGVAGYNLYRNGTLIDTSSSMFSYNDQNLTPGETYTYTVNAFDASGNVSATSAPLSVETTDTTPPSVPTGLMVTGTTSTSVSLSWNPSTGIGGVGGYRVLRGTSPTAMSIHASPTTTSYTDSCRPSTTYYYAVESFNPIGINSAAGPTVQVTTPSK